MDKKLICRELFLKVWSASLVVFPGVGLLKILSIYSLFSGLMRGRGREGWLVSEAVALFNLKPTLTTWKLLSPPRQRLVMAACRICHDTDLAACVEPTLMTEWRDILVSYSWIILVTAWGVTCSFWDLSSFSSAFPSCKINHKEKSNDSRKLHCAWSK